MTIGALSDDALLEVFDFYVDEEDDIEGWHTLIHVCQRWRSIVFASQRRLHLRLLCTERRPVKQMLDVWPALPIIIRQSGNTKSLVEGTDNIIAALERRDRVCEICLPFVPGRLLEKFVALMQGPFPALIHLTIQSNGESPPTLPDSFLGGSAPHLRSFYFSGVLYPALRKLLLSASHLVHLELRDVPQSDGYVSTEAIVMCLSSLTRLQTLALELFFPPPYPAQESRRPSPMTRGVLPVLKALWFKGFNAYLEDILAYVDAPLLGFANIWFCNQVIFEFSQLSQFLSRTEMLETVNQVNLVFLRHSARARFHAEAGAEDYAKLELGVSCKESDWQLSALAQICSSPLPNLSDVECLDIREDQTWGTHWQDDVEDAQWLELFHPFTVVKSLYLSKEIAVRVAPALQDLTRGLGNVTEVLPVLQNIFLEEPQSLGPAQEAIRQFLAARQRSRCPVAIHRWEIIREMWYEIDD